MAKNYHRFPTPGSCASSNFATADFCLPLKQDCGINEDDFLGEFPPWTIEPCNDPTYCNPVMAGDEINFQTQFPGSDPDNPSFGLTGELFGAAGESLSTELGQFGSGCEGFNGDNFFQSVMINTGAVAGIAGAGRFSVQISDGNSTLTSQCYEFIDGECQYDTHILRGEYDGKDCFGREYNDPNCAFSNSIRLYSDIVDIGGSVQKQYFGERSVRNTMEWDYVLALTKRVPYFIKNSILVILNADRVFIDDQEVRIAESFRVVNKLQRETQFIFDIPFQFRCDRKGLC